MPTYFIKATFIAFISLNLLIYPLLAKPPVIIEADKMELNNHSQTLKASGNLVITNGDIKLKGHHALYNQKHSTLHIQSTDYVLMTQGLLTISSKDVMSNILDQVFIASGNTTVFFPPYSGRSDNIVYNRTINTITLKGNPILSQGEDELLAEEITIDLNRKKVYSKGYTKYKSIKEE